MTSLSDTVPRHEAMPRLLVTTVHTVTPPTVKAGTSPSIAAGPNGTFEVAFAANSGVLCTFSPATYGVDRGYAMKAGTSTAITAVSGGYEIAFQANTTELWIENPSAGGVDWGSGMHSGSNPSIAY